MYPDDRSKWTIEVSRLHEVVRRGCYEEVLINKRERLCSHTLDHYKIGYNPLPLIVPSDTCIRLAVSILKRTAIIEEFIMKQYFLSTMNSDKNAKGQALLI